MQKDKPHRVGRKMSYEVLSFIVIVSAVATLLLWRALSRKATANNYAIRASLRQRQTLVAHFSTVMATKTRRIFPYDLLDAMSLRDEPLSFSTVRKGDRFRQGAEGSVGIVVSLGEDTVVESVRSGDSASGNLGLSPTRDNVDASIDNRQTSNEWRIKNYMPVGIVILEPVFVRKAFVIDENGTPQEVEYNPQAVIDGSQLLHEKPISFEEVIEHFKNERIFRVTRKTFLEFDRKSNSWKPLSYDEIIPP
jgi:hypothetical protein